MSHFRLDAVIFLSPRVSLLYFNNRAERTHGLRRKFALDITLRREISRRINAPCSIIDWANISSSFIQFILFDRSREKILAGNCAVSNLRFLVARSIIHRNIRILYQFKFIKGKIAGNIFRSSGIGG